MAYGVTLTGFVKKTYAVVKEDFLDGVEAGLGMLARQAYETASRAANKLLVVQERIADLWDLAESVYAAMYPDSATGASLDGACALTGTVRLAATESTVTEVMRGTIGTTIPLGSKVKTSTIGDEFETLAALTLSNLTCSHGYVKLNGPIAAGAYTVTINSTSYTFTAVGGETEADIFSEASPGLAYKINNGAEPASATYSASTNELIIAGDTDPDTSLPTPFSVTVTANLQVAEVGNMVAMQSVNTGKLVALASTLSDIVSAVAGWSEAWNPLDATLGRNTETDAELRLRRANSLANPGSGTLEAIRAAVLEVQGVTAGFVLENTSNVVMDTIEPHAFECVVQGGASASLVDQIWEHKPAGIYSDGDTAVTLTDSQGFQQTVRFTRPTDVLMWVRFTVTPDTELGTLPDNYEDQLAAAVETWGASEQIGHDCVPDQIRAYCMGEVPGICTLVVEVVDNASYPGSYQTAPWTIGSRELAKYASGRVEFV